MGAWAITGALIYYVLVLGCCSCMKAGVVREVPGGDVSAIGTGVYLPEVNILDIIQGARSLFASDLSGAISTTDYPVTKISSQFYESTTSFYTYIAEKAGLLGGTNAVPFSLQETFNSISGGESQVSSLAINAVAFSQMRSMIEEKAANVALNPELVRDMEALPVAMNVTWVATSWATVAQFLRKWGSHYVTTAYFGSWMQQWSVADMSKSYSAKNFTSHACLKLEGPTSTSVDACALVTALDKRDATSYDMSDILYVKGGNASTRASLTRGRTPELVQRFLEEGAHATSPTIQYKFTPIWELLRQRFPAGSQPWQVARNLEAYYAGMKGFGCYLQESSTGLFLQYLRGVKDELGTYFECVRPCQGCMSNTDCHIGGFIASQCYCYGPSCVVLDSNNRATIRSSPSSGDVNKSCKYQLGIRCRCSPHWEPSCPSDGLFVQWSQRDLASTTTSIHI